MERNFDWSRNTAIDMLRALTMALMIFVNDFWKVHGVPQWMLHAEVGVDFIGLSDIVYPLFLFAVGMSVPYALENRFRKGFSTESTLGHILMRSFALMIMGCVIGNASQRLPQDFSLYKIGFYWILMVLSFICIWNAYPNKDISPARKCLFVVLRCLGIAGLFFLALTYRSPKGFVFDIRWSILGSIGWTYLVVAIIYLLTRSDLRKLALVWTAMLVLCALTNHTREELGGSNLLGFQEPNFLGGILNAWHIGNNTLLCLGGVIFSVIIAMRGFSPQMCNGSSVKPHGRQFAQFVLSALTCFILLGSISRKVWIAAKIGLTIPCIFYIYALAMALYAVFIMLCRNGLTRWYEWLFKPAGTVTLTTYMIPYVFYGFADIFNIVLPDWLTYPPMALLNCLGFSLIVIFIAGVLERVHIKLKI